MASGYLRHARIGLDSKNIGSELLKLDRGDAGPSPDIKDSHVAMRN